MYIVLNQNIFIFSKILTQIYFYYVPTNKFLDNLVLTIVFNQSQTSFERDPMDLPLLSEFPFS